ncbi:MAG: 3-phosphoshikimate 1-carboxyvinyltransferase [bacterium]
MDQFIAPAKRISGRIQLAGDKSISHRALMIGAVSEGTTEIENLSDGADVLSTAACLKSLGIQIEKKKNRTYVHGKGLFGLREYSGILNAENSGTTIRLLSGILAGQKFSSTITGDEPLRKRPMSRIIKPLRQMGAKIDAVNGNFAPLSITGQRLIPITYKLPVASAQVKSCLLFAGLYAEGTTEICEPCPTRDHTERMLQTFGAKIEQDELKVSIAGQANLQAQTIFVPGDLSLAAFFIAAAILIKDSELKIEQVGINPSRTAFLSILSDMGAEIDIVNTASINQELVADIFVRSSTLKGVKVRGAVIPQIIDEIPILAVLATQAQGTTEIQDARELRIKESDRLSTVTYNLKKMGAEVKELKDGLMIQGPVKLRGAELNSFKDHRIAMSFAIAGLVAGQGSIMKGAEFVNISFPQFFKQLDKVTIG